ncbi:MAG: hypothetical protein Q4G63_00515 [Bacteroidia bacterium]|nr:hypothetical protein [Bacteroidia bacterium]
MYVLFLFGISILAVHAQKDPIYRIGIEIGGGVLEGNTIGDKWNIRQDVGGYSSHNLPHDHEFGSNSSFISMGIKSQVSLLNERIDILSGLHFTMFNTSIKNHRNNVIYLRMDNPNAVEFYKISGINEKVGYLSIPLEMNYHFFRRNVFKRSRISLFGKAGAEAGIKLYGNTNINFVSDAMKSHEKEVLQSRNLKLNNFYSTFYLGCGFQFTDGNDIQYSYEVKLPGALLTKNNSNIIRPNAFVSAHLSVKFPIQLILKK